MAETKYAPRLIVTRDKTTEQFALRRHQIDAEDELLSFATYSIDGHVMTVSHVETLAEHRGNNFAAMLMAGVLDDIAFLGFRIRPTCSFAASYMIDHADMRHLMVS